MAVVALLVAAVVVSTLSTSGSERDIVIGTPEPRTATAAAGPLIVAPALAASAVAAPAAAGPHARPRRARRARRGRRGASRRAPALKQPDGRPYGNAIAFNTGIRVPEHLVFVLVVGSDARPRQDVLRSNADAIHLLAVNPRTLQGTVVGFPRDLWVSIPGRRMGKLTTALNGGPDLLAETVRRLTGLPVDYYVVTGFGGLSAMVDALGGVNVLVDQRMNDRFSGARFEPGWHRFNGAQALAFSRNRHVAHGDFARSANQGKLMLAALSKMRAEVGNDDQLSAWLRVLLGHARLNAPAAQLIELAGLARRVDVAQMRSVVVPGRIGKAARQSVVFVDGPNAARIFNDLRPDAVLGPPGPEVATTTTTTAPPAPTAPTLP